MELSEKTKKAIREYEMNYEKWLKEGKFTTLEQVKKELGIESEVSNFARQ